MPTKLDFDEFVKRQQGQAQQEPFVDWTKKRDKWLQALEVLYSSIEGFLEEYISRGQVQIEFKDKVLNEEYIGLYLARQMILKIGRQEVALTPVGTLLIGTEGRVDVRGPAGEARLILADKNSTGVKLRINVTSYIQGDDYPLSKKMPEPDDLEWKLVSRPPDVKFISLTQKIFPGNDP